MKIIPVGVVLLQLAMGAAAQAQAIDDEVIRVGGFETAANGAEKSAGVWHEFNPMSLGKSVAGEWSMLDCGYFAVSVAHNGFEERAITGWRVEITPTRVVDRAVSFRLRWVRAFDKSSKEATFASEDTELTLKPGEERTFDRVPVPQGAKTMNGKACQTSAASLRVSVDNYPPEDLDRRLIAADIWLVERLPNGGERSQPLSVRGLPNRSMPFYFDSIADGHVSLEIFGEVVARPEQDGLAVALLARSRTGESSFDWHQDGNWPEQVESTLHVKPQEIVEVALPKLGGGAGPFASRVFSIRIRARELR
jgi:hypothetical protein